MHGVLRSTPWFQGVLNPRMSVGPFSLHGIVSASLILCLLQYLFHLFIVVHCFIIYANIIHIFIQTSVHLLSCTHILWKSFWLHNIGVHNVLDMTLICRKWLTTYLCDRKINGGNRKINTFSYFYKLWKLITKISYSPPQILRHLENLTEALVMGCFPPLCDIWVRSHPVCALAPQLRGNLQSPRWPSCLQAALTHP